MRRDDDYLRALLLEFEQSNDFSFIGTLFQESDRDDEKRYYHILLATDAGLMTQNGDYEFRLTAQGHDYLDAIRDEGIWNKTKAVVAETGGNATIEILKSLAGGFLKTKIKEQTGYEL